MLSSGVGLFRGALFGDFRFELTRLMRAQTGECGAHVAKIRFAAARLR